MRLEYVIGAAVLIVVGAYCLGELTGRFMDWREKNRTRRDYE